jgi:energy-converting hydrogenase Eha subunit C
MPLTGQRATVEAPNIAGGKVVMEIAEMRVAQRWRIFGWGLALAILAMPFVALQLHTQGVDWSAGDFVFAAVIFATVGGLLELAVRLTPSRLYRGAAALALLGGLLVVWINLAVGIVGSEHNPDNQLFFVALLMAIAGGIGARFKADGMKRAMITAAVAVVIAFAIAESGRQDEPMVHPLVEGIGTSIFVLLFVGSAWLFRKAAMRQSSSSS